MGFLSRVGRVLLDFIIITVAILVYPGIPPNAEMDNRRFPPAPPFEGVYAPNGRLTPMERLLDQQVDGPESTADWHGAVYTGVDGGAILRLNEDGTAVQVAQMGLCENRYDRARCGRPLGLRFDRGGLLLVADAYLGIHRVNVTSGDKELLVPAGLEVNDKPLRFFNDVIQARSGIVYFTTSSSFSDMHTGFLELAVRGTGRLFQYDPERNETRQLMSGINFANGVALDDQEASLLVSETGMYRVHRYWLKGERAHTSEILVENLPGFPDNIRARNGGGFYVALCNLRYQNQPHEQLRPYPLVVKLLTRVFYLIMTPVTIVERIYPNAYTQAIIYRGLTLKTAQTLLAVDWTPHGVVVELDARGAVVGSLHSADMRCLSQLSEHAGALYAGSPFSEFLGRVRPAEQRTVRVKTTSSDDTLSVSVGGI